MLRYALVDGKRVEPEKGQHGTCPHCHGEVIAKCGSVKVHHWAHKNIDMCDKWWENKTDWHRNWQDRFPKEWQEVRVENQDGSQWHIADICTPDGLVVEFQHSFLDEDTIKERTRFYIENGKLLIWVVHVLKKRDIVRFCTGRNCIDIKISNLKYINDWQHVMPIQWQFYNGFLFFDIEGDREHIYSFIPGQFENDCFFVTLNKDLFVEYVYWRQKFVDWNLFLKSEINCFLKDKNRVRQLLCDLMRVKENLKCYCCGRKRIWEPISIYGLEEITFEMAKRFPRE